MYDINLIIATIAKASSINFTILMLLPSHFLCYNNCDAVVTLLQNHETKCTLHTHTAKKNEYIRKKVKVKVGSDYEEQDTISSKGIRT